MNVLSKEIVNEFFNYDALTGSLTWKERDLSWFKSETAAKIWNKQFPGKNVGTDCGKGYLKTQIFGKKVLVHRICWVFVNGWTDLEIDHINGMRNDNRIENLRPARKIDNRMNQGIPKNNKSGHLGVSWISSLGKWMASISKEGKKVNLGVFELKDDAISARQNANKEFGYHQNHGKRKSHNLESVGHG